MKNFLTFLATIFTVAMLIYAIGYTVPKLVDIYSPKDIIEKSDTVFEHDTLYFEAKKTDSIPKIKYETIRKRDTIYLHSKDSDVMIPRVITLKKKDYEDTLQMGQDTLVYRASVTGRSYEDEDLPKLDSISLILKGYNLKDKEVITIEKIVRQKRRKWAIGAQVGYGYGFKSKMFEPYAGFGISYNF